MGENIIDMTHNDNYRCKECKGRQYVILLLCHKVPFLSENDEFAAEVVPKEHGGCDEDFYEAVVKLKDGYPEPHPKFRPEEPERTNHAKDEEGSDGPPFAAIFRLYKDKDKRKNIINDEPREESADCRKIHARGKVLKKELLCGDEYAEVHKKRNASHYGIAQELAEKCRERGSFMLTYLLGGGGYLWG